MVELTDSKAEETLHDNSLYAMPPTIKLRKGLNIRLGGTAARSILTAPVSRYYAVIPDDFPGLVPKLNVREGDMVLAGSPLFHDKRHPEILFTSPVSGTVHSLVRGERRKLMEVVIERNGEEYIDFGKADPGSLGREDIIAKLLHSGLWPAVRQRPYHVVATPGNVPKSIFISGFDTAPLAPDYNFILENSPSDIFRTGLIALKKLTDGKLHLVLDGSAGTPEVLKQSDIAEISYFSGPHPAGNTGVHIHHLDPVNKGEVVWFVNLQDIIAVGRLFADGVYKPERLIALAGSEVVQTGYFRVLSGTSVSGLIRNNTRSGNLRYISGNVLTGRKINSEGYLGYYDSLLTVLPEGDSDEFLGWLSGGIKKYSFSRTYLSGFRPRPGYRLDTNQHGGERAFVMTGQYEKVVPMDIYPMQLLKAILAEDIDMMENLGIYEVAEEDFALCEFICPSKIGIQAILRNGINLMIKEMH